VDQWIACKQFLRWRWRNFQTRKFATGAFLWSLLRYFPFVLPLLLAGDAIYAVPVGPAQVINSINPKMCIHTRLTDEVEPWKIRQTLQLAVEMGARRIVEYFPWAYVERTPGHDDWSHDDLVMRHIHGQGLKVIARLGLVPRWARPRQSIDSYIDADHYQDFAAYAARFAVRYRRDIAALVVWNEPNLRQEWGSRPPDPAAYTALLCRVYRAVKAVAPDMIVLGGALAPTIAPPQNTQATTDLAYLQALYEAGAGHCFDGLAAHAYGWTAPANAAASHSAINFRRVELLHQVMAKHGDSGKRIWITEGGWNDHPRWTKAVLPGQRIAYTVAAYDITWHDWPWAATFCPWVLRFPRPTYTYQDNFTFVDVDFTPKPIYWDVRAYARGEKTP